MPLPPTPEESFLWNCAVSWRSPAEIQIPTDLDWDRVAEVGVTNRMAWLLRNLLEATGRWESVPESARIAIGEFADRLQENAEMLGESLKTYLDKAEESGIETVVLKGLSISENVYGSPAMRPGGDIDILVRQKHVQPSMQVLETMDIGPFWPNLMADPYYERHHLHHQRSSKDLKIWFEIHWALDHPYTLFTVDYEAIMDRCLPGTLLGSHVRELSPPDLILTLAVHLVKHAIYLPSTYAREDLQRAVLADGMLMYYLDIAETIRKYAAEMDWPALVRLAEETGSQDVIGSVLQACRHLLGAEIPDEIIAAIPVRRQGPVTAWAMQHVVDREIKQYQGEKPSRFWDAMLITNGAFILRPICLLELMPYFLPPRDFLDRKYGRSNLVTRAKHFFRALVQFAAFGWDSVYFVIERYRRLKRIGFSTSLFNRLETEG